MRPRLLRLRRPPRRVREHQRLGFGKSYARFTVPYGGYLFPGFDLNHSYADCDVLISLAKLKQHVRAGVTLSLKNCFGNLPLSIYGTSAGIDEPAEKPGLGFRGEVMHVGWRRPSLSAPQEVNPASPRDTGYRLPRVGSSPTSWRPVPSTSPSSTASKP